MRTRTVLLLGRRPSVKLDELGKGLRKDDYLVVLSLGYPVTSAQREVLLTAQGLAERAGAWFDALLVTSADEMLASLRPGDDVQVAVQGFRGRRLRRALAAFPR